MLNQLVVIVIDDIRKDKVLLLVPNVLVKLSRKIQEIKGQRYKDGNNIYWIKRML